MGSHPRLFPRGTSPKDARVRVLVYARDPERSAWIDQELAREDVIVQTARTVAELVPAFAARAASLGLSSATIRYDDAGLTAKELDERLDSDLERGTTGAGPHLRDVLVAAAGRDLRNFGSQGEQRTAVLALTLAEALLLGGRRGEPPLLLLDDVLSELDGNRRWALLEDLPAEGQTVVTATTRDALPRGAAEPSLVVVVTPGSARPQ